MVAKGQNDETEKAYEKQDPWVACNDCLYTLNNMAHKMISPSDNLLLYFTTM